MRRRAPCPARSEPHDAPALVDDHVARERKAVSAVVRGVRAVAPTGRAIGPRPGQGPAWHCGPRHAGPWWPASATQLQPPCCAQRCHCQCGQHPPSGSEGHGPRNRRSSHDRCHRCPGGHRPACRRSRRADRCIVARRHVAEHGASLHGDTPDLAAAPVEADSGNGRDGRNNGADGQGGSGGHGALHDGSMCSP